MGELCKQEGQKWGIENFRRFCSYIVNQFEHGGSKYAFDERSEWTDVLTAVNGAWVPTTIAKYVGRRKSFGRSRDLFKIATYCFLMWLQEGHYTNSRSMENTLFSTSVEVKRKHWISFKNAVEMEFANVVCDRSVMLDGQQVPIIEILEKFQPGYILARMFELSYDMSTKRNRQAYIRSGLMFSLFVLAFCVWVMDGDYLNDDQDEDVSREKVDVEAT